MKIILEKKSKTLINKSTINFLGGTSYIFTIFASFKFNANKKRIG